MWKDLADGYMLARAYINILNLYFRLAMHQLQEFSNKKNPED